MGEVELRQPALQLLGIPLESIKGPMDSGVAASPGLHSEQLRPRGVGYPTLRRQLRAGGNAAVARQDGRHFAQRHLRGAARCQLIEHLADTGTTPCLVADRNVEVLQVLLDGQAGQRDLSRGFRQHRRGPVAHGAERPAKNFDLLIGESSEVRDDTMSGPAVLLAAEGLDQLGVAVRLAIAFDVNAADEHRL